MHRKCKSHSEHFFIDYSSFLSSPFFKVSKNNTISLRNVSPSVGEAPESTLFL